MVDQICSSCGKENSEHVYETFSYCAQCESERKDKSVRPLVREYIGQSLGSLPNQRGPILYSLEQLGFAEVGLVETHRDRLQYFVRQPDNQPMGLIAIITLDGYVVIVNGKQDLLLLLEHDSFSQNPIVTNLPRVLVGADNHNLNYLRDHIAKLN